MALPSVVSTHQLANVSIPAPTPSARGGVNLYLEHRADNTVYITANWWLAEFTPGGQAAFLTVDFGDGTTETVPTGGWTLDEESLSHTYSAPGTYPVTATVVGSSNTFATGKSTIMVGNRLALASFAEDRSTGAFTDPEIGGPWVTSANTRPDGFLLAARGVTESAYLLNTWIRDVDTKVSVRIQSPDEGRTMFTLAARHRSDGDYAVKVVYENAPAQSVTLTLIKRVDGVETTLARIPAPEAVRSAFNSSYISPAGSYRQRDAVVRFQVTTESGQTVLRAKIWQTAKQEPAEWLVTGTDADPRLQRMGQIGIEGYNSTTTRFDDALSMLVGQLEATAPGGLG